MRLRARTPRGGGTPGGRGKRPRRRTALRQQRDQLPGRLADVIMVATHQSQELRLSFLDKVDALLFAFAGLATIWLADLLIAKGTRPDWQMLLLVLFWVLLTAFSICTPSMFRLFRLRLRPMLERSTWQARQTSRQLGEKLLPRRLSHARPRPSAAVGPCQTRQHGDPQDRVRRRLGPGSRGPADRGEGGHPRPGRPGGATAPVADGRLRRVHLHRADRRGDAA